MIQSKHVVILVIILLLSVITRGQQQDGSVFERRITIHQQNQSLEFILDQISWQAGVFFSYDATIINSKKNFSIEANNKSLFTVLNELFDPKLYQLTELQNQIIITRTTVEDQPEIIVSDSIPVKYFFLSGKLVESRKGKPVSYASVSVFNKPIGTISNTDGDFILKLHPDYIRDTLIISSMGYAQIRVPASTLLDEDLFILEPISIKIKEIKVTAITADKLLANMRENLRKNYSANSKLMTAFYRETVEQDNRYISVSEAVMEILKSPYINSSRNDLVRLLKGRKSPDVQTFKWMNFKLQGGPFNITKLDVVRTVETFIDKQFENLYHYEVSDVIWYNDNPVYVVKFYPVMHNFYPAFEGEMYVHRETFALVHAKYNVTKSGLKEAEEILIKRKPRNVKARPTSLQYQVSYRQYQGKWQLATAQASVKFRVKSKRDKINSEFHSISDLLVTDISSTDLKRFSKDEQFSHNDIFVEVLGKYDEKYWENYNIIKPNEDLRNAFKDASMH